MLTRHAALLLRLCTVLALILSVVPLQAAAAPPIQGMSSPLMVYHQLTKRPDGSSQINASILNGDGRRAFWAERKLMPDLKMRNQIFALELDGGQPTEIDAYQSLCEGCTARVDVSDDGNTVVSTEGVRIRVLSGVATFG
jgi:hypothetical protein